MNGAGHTAGQSDIAEFMAEQTRNGVVLWAEQGQLRFKGPQSVLTPPWLATLKNRKQDILQWLALQLEEQGINPAGDGIGDGIEREFPLSASQAAIWMLQKFAPQSAVYNTALFLRLKSVPNQSATVQALQSVLHRHALLRTTFHDADDGPQQRVHKQLPPNLEFIDAGSWPEQTLQQWLDAEADAPFALARDSLLRVKVLNSSVRGPMMVVTVHHLVADLWALLLIAQDINILMQQHMRGEVMLLPSPDAHYHQHVQAQARWLESEAATLLWHYWQERLAGAPCTLELPTDFPRPPLMQFEPHKCSLLLAPVWSDRLRNFCRAQAITPFALFQAGMQLLVHLQTGEHDFLVGTPTVGRHEKGSESVVGDFANPVILRAMVNPQHSVTAFLAQVRQSLLDAMAHDAFPYPELVQRLNPPRDASRAPLFQLMFLWHQAQIDMAKASGWIEEMLPQSGPRGTPYDLMLSVSDLKTTFECHFMAPKALFRAETLERLSQQFRRIIEFLVENTGHRLQDLINVVIGDAPAKETHFTATPLPALEHDLYRRLPPMQRDHVIVCRPLGNGETHKCLFVAAADSALIAALQGCDFLDDVINLPALPRNAEGEFDVDVLTRIPTVNARQLHSVSEHLAVVHTLHHQPYFDHASICLQAGQISNAPGANASVAAEIPDISHRPLAYASGGPLAVDNSQDVCHLLAALQRSAEYAPQRGIHYLDQHGRQADFLSYAALERLSVQGAAVLQGLGLAAGDIVILQIKDRKCYHLCFWSLLRLGAIPLTIANPEQWSERDAVALKVRNVANRMAGSHILADHSTLQMAAWVGDQIRVHRLPADIAGAQQPAVDGLADECGGLATNAAPWNAEGVAFLQLTSGSTGTPKAIQMTHRGILQHIAAAQAHNGYQPEDITLNWLPYDHVVPLLTTHIKDVVLGCDQLQLPTAAVLADPLLWLRVMSTWRVTHSWSPNFGFQLVAEQWQKTPDLSGVELRDVELRDVELRDVELRGIDLSAVRFLMNAGEQVLAPTVHAFLSACVPLGLSPHAMQPAFGMAECCTCMTYLNTSDEKLAVDVDIEPDSQVLQIRPGGRHRFVSLGTVVPGVEIRITDSCNQIVRECVTGRLQIRGAVVTPGYLNNPAANQEAFVGDGWFNSGDLGFLWEGQLYVTGREKEMIVVRGSNYYCHEIEHLVTVAGVSPTFVAATGVQSSLGAPEALVLFYVSEGSRSEFAIEAEIMRIVQQVYGITPSFVLPVPIAGFYKTTSGKIQRSQFKAQFESGFYREAMLAFDYRHQLNLLKPAAYLRRMVAERLRPLVESLVATDLCLVAPETQRYTLGLIPALADKHWQFSNSESAFMECLDTNPVRENGVLMVVLPPAQEKGAANTSTLLAFLKLLLSGINTWRFTGTLILLAVDPAISQDPASDSLLELKPIMESLRSEQPDLRSKCIVLASRNVGWQCVHDEVMQFTHDTCVLLSERYRLVPRLSRYRFSAPDRHSAFAPKASEVWVVTGGTGALGQALCRLLLDRYDCRLLILQRKGNDEKSLQTASSLRRDAGKINYLHFDPNQLDVLPRLLDEALRIHGMGVPAGVFHLAGTMTLSTLAANSDNKSNDSASAGTDWQRTCAGKVTLAETLASWLQEAATGAAFVQYSSLNGFFGGHSAGLYGAANALQGRLTDRLNAEAKLRAWTLHWSLWEGMGMSARLDTHQIAMARNQGYLALQQDDAHRLLAALLTQAPGNYYIGVDETHQAISPWIHNAIDAWRRRSACLAETGANAMHFSLLLSRTTLCLPGYRARVGGPALEWQRENEPFPRDAQGRINTIRLAERHSAIQQRTILAPRNDTETRMLALWNECLPNPVFAVDDNFFDRGGHSISAARLVARINQTFGVQWPVATLFQQPSVAALSALLDNGKGASSAIRISPSIVALLCAEKRKILRFDAADAAALCLWVPPLLGDPGVYAPLISDVAIAGLSWQEGMLVPESGDIATQARRYVDVCLSNMDTRQPIVLVGWSFGGVLAFELAHQLYLQGVTVAGVVLLDAAIGDAIPWPLLNTHTRRLLFLREIAIEWAEFAAEELPDNVWCERLRQVLGEQAAEIPATALETLFNRFCTRLQALHRYQPADWRVEHYPVRYLKADRNMLGTEHMGWQGLFKQFQVSVVNADHHQILHDPHTRRQILELQQVARYMVKGDSYVHAS